MEQKLSEERSAKLRLENRILELEKHSSMMDCDYKQALQKLEELRRHKDHLTEEVSEYAGSQSGLFKCHPQQLKATAAGCKHLLLNAFIKCISL